MDLKSMTDDEIYVQRNVICAEATKRESAAALKAQVSALVVSARDAGRTEADIDSVFEAVKADVF